jgi:hypothetical protein
LLKAPHGTKYKGRVHKAAFSRIQNSTPKPSPGNGHTCNLLTRYLHFQSPACCNARCNMQLAVMIEPHRLWQGPLSFNPLFVVLK